MKIKVLKLIENALIGGRNGEMSYIYNNPLIFEIFNEWKNKKENFHIHKNDGDIAFKEFLKECLKECLKEDIVESEIETPQVIGYKTLTKEYGISHSDEDYKEWKTLEINIRLEKIRQRDLVQAIAKKYNAPLAEISNLKIQDSYLGKTIVFEFSVEAILEDKQQEEN